MRLFRRASGRRSVQANIALTEIGMQSADLPKNRSGRPLCGAVHLLTKLQGRSIPGPMERSSG